MRPDSVSATDAGLDRTKSSMLIRLARGDGVILDGDLRPFHDAVARPAEPPEVDAWLERIRPNRSALTIGDLLLAPGVAAALDAGGFNRHSFMCGQSGSGSRLSPMPDSPRMKAPVLRAEQAEVRHASSSRSSLCRPINEPPDSV